MHEKTHTRQFRHVRKRLAERYGIVGFTEDEWRSLWRSARIGDLIPVESRTDGRRVVDMGVRGRTVRVMIGTSCRPLTVLHPDTPIEILVSRACDGAFL